MACTCIDEKRKKTREKIDSFTRSPDEQHPHAFFQFSTSRQNFPMRAEHESVEFKSTDPVSRGPLNHPHNSSIENRQARVATKVAALYSEDGPNVTARQIGYGVLVALRMWQFQDATSWIPVEMSTIEKITRLKVVLTSTFPPTCGQASWILRDVARRGRPQGFALTRPL